MGEVLEQTTVGLAERFAVGAGAEDERPHPLAAVDERQLQRDPCRRDAVDCGEPVGGRGQLDGDIGQPEGVRDRVDHRRQDIRLTDRLAEASAER
jgi:hypothetical protein